MPDLLCLSKGLTGGFLPLAAVLATQQFYYAFLDDSRERAFLHSHSYTGNPLACAAALATLDIFDRRRAGAQPRIARRWPNWPHRSPITARRRRASGRDDRGLRADPRRRQAHAVPGQQRIGLHAYRAALDRGVVLRPLATCCTGCRLIPSTTRNCPAGRNHPDAIDEALA